MDLWLNCFGLDFMSMISTSDLATVKAQLVYCVFVLAGFVLLLFFVVVVIIVLASLAYS